MKEDCLYQRPAGNSS